MPSPQAAPQLPAFVAQGSGASGCGCHSAGVGMASGELGKMTKMVDYLLYGVGPNEEAIELI
jgi:hypothetical protein